MNSQSTLTEMKNQLTIGCFEIVSFPGLGITNQLAKVDTGAYSGAIHCTDITVVRRGPEKIRILKFSPLGKKKLATETDTFIETYVRSATGHRIKRYLIDTEIRLGDESYPIKIGLSDRSDMKRTALIGRRFLRENAIAVDVRIHQEYDDEGKKS